MVGSGPATREILAADLRELGITAGDIVMVHASVRSIGPIEGGVETLVNALLDSVGAVGTLVAYVDWQVDDVDPYGPDVPVFDKRISRAAREYGILAETIRAWPGAVRSDNPDAGIAAVGARAEWLCAGHQFSWGYGENSPFAKLVAAGAKVLVLGAPLDTMTILHHAEHLAKIQGKRVIRYRRKIAQNGRVELVDIAEFDTSVPIVDGMPADAFARIAQSALTIGAGRRGVVGKASSYVFDAAALVKEGVRRLESSVFEPD